MQARRIKMYIKTSRFSASSESHLVGTTPRTLACVPVASQTINAALDASSDSNKSPIYSSSCSFCLYNKYALRFLVRRRRPRRRHLCLHRSLYLVSNLCFVGKRHLILAAVGVS